jgi:hypothetical protein
MGRVSAKLLRVARDVRQFGLGFCGNFRPSSHRVYFVLSVSERNDAVKGRVLKNLDVAVDERGQL